MDCRHGHQNLIKRGHDLSSGNANFAALAIRTLRALKVFAIHDAQIVGYWMPLLEGRRQLVPWRIRYHRKPELVAQDIVCPSDVLKGVAELFQTRSGG